MAKESIVDASVPSAGRIYDYLLGGYHNFEVDRQVANQIMQLNPFVPKAMRLQRWCLQDIAVELTERRGFDTIIDFASGLPTQDHIHAVAPAGTTVIYSDYDPVVVEYAREILGATPNVYFFEADARRPEELLNRQEVKDILAGKRNVAVIYWGIALFLTDDDLTHAAQKLYEWTGEQSCWVFNAQGAVEPGMPLDHPVVLQMQRMYAAMGSGLNLRTKERYQELVRPWRPDSRGFISLVDWHGLDRSELVKADALVGGAAGAGYGVYLDK